MKRNFNSLLKCLPAAVIFVLSASGILHAQIDDKMSENLKFADNTQSVDSEYTGTVSSVFAGMIKGYQVYIGPYYPSRCPFYPSCSNYGLQSVQEYGGFWGSIMAFERLTRCNLRRDEYPVSKTTMAHGNNALWDLPANNYVFSDSCNLDDVWFFGDTNAVLATNKYDIEIKLLSENAELKKNFGFAGELLFAKNYPDAIREFKRINYYYPEDPDTEKVVFMLGMTSFLSKDWHEANNSFAAFLYNHPDSPLKNEALFRLSYSLIKTKDYKFAERSAGEIIKNAQSTAEEKSEAEFFKFIIALEQKDGQKAVSGKNALAKNYDVKIGVTDEELSAISGLPERSEFLGSTFSAILPGSGQLYAGRYYDALSTFAITGTFAYGTYEAYQQDLDTAALVLGSTFLIFYTANVYGGARAVHQYNNESASRYIRAIKSKAEMLNRYWFFVSQEQTGYAGVSIDF
ncbi:MAG: membrane protein insertion efficiency factor YidD [Planctomycetes bacterium]|nr:membrane protein insertion efficiency factor YidD [Planctomycetota bacterium]